MLLVFCRGAVPYEGNGWKPTAITRFVKSLGTSVSPVRVDTDCGEGFLKVLGNPEGSHALARELAGSLVAEWLGLPTLDFAVVNVAPTDNIPLAHGELALPGPAFISRAENNAFTWGGDIETLQRLKSRDAITGLVVIDTWLSNFDRYAPDGGRRNRGNVFLIEHSERERGLELRVMDFTHAFTLAAPLDHRLGFPEKIADPRIYGLFPEFKSLIQRTVMVSLIQQMVTFNHDDAKRIINMVPAAWNVNQQARSAWVNFLVERARFVGRTLENQIWPQMRLEGTL